MLNFLKNIFSPVMKASYYNELVLCDDQGRYGWFREKYYFNGASFRYSTFQIALNILSQTVQSPLIVETGCQRQKDDIGGGMSTSIFGEYAKRYGGRVITVDIDPNSLNACKKYTKDFSDRITYVLSDSVAYLATLQESPDLLYLDSLDFDVIGQNRQINERSQNHCLNEFKTIEPRLKPTTILLADDSGAPGGGKPKKLKEYLINRGWICLMDWQQSLWVKQIQGREKS